MMILASIHSREYLLGLQSLLQLLMWGLVRKSNAFESCIWDTAEPRQCPLWGGYGAFCWGYMSIAHIPILVISLFPFSLKFYYIIHLSHIFSICQLLVSHLLTEAEMLSIRLYLLVYCIVVLYIVPFSVFTHIKYIFFLSKLRFLF